MKLTDAAVGHFLDTGKAATVKDLARITERSTSSVNREINMERGCIQGCDGTQVEQPVVEKNYGTILRYSRVRAFIPSRHTLRAIILESRR